MSDPPTIVWAARIAPTKDPQILVRAATKLKSLGLRFRIILAGSAPHYLEWYGLQIRDFINQHGLRDCIETPGWVDDVPSLYRHAAIGVQTSETEGLSMTLLEQMMAGLAIVATDVGDTAIAIEHEKNGLLIPPGDDQALIEALTRVITDRDLRMRLGRNARADAIQRFTCRAMAEGALEII
jgi:glycosyltransferase involved in cell wall biosynthesis